MKNTDAPKNDEMTHVEMDNVVGGDGTIRTCGVGAPPPYRPCPPYWYPGPIIIGDPYRTPGPILLNGEWHF